MGIKRKLTALLAITTLIAGTITVYGSEEGVTLTKEICKEQGISLSGDVVIPESVIVNGENQQISCLGSALFQGNLDVTSVTLPDTIIKIDSYCFDGCTNLRSINFPENLEEIGNAAFQLCSSLESIDLNDSLLEIHGFGFNHCSKVTNDTVHLGKNLRSLWSKLYAPAHMFYDFGKDNFKAFDVDWGNSTFESQDGILYTEDMDLLISIPRGKVFENEVYEMPNTVKYLGELSFSRNMNITSLVISDQLTVDSELSAEERWCYLNHGNDLSRAIYTYCPVREYKVRSTNEKYLSIDGVLYTRDGRTLVAVPNKYNQGLVIPEGVVEWQKEALWSELDSFNGSILNEIPFIEIPSTLEKIPSSQLETVNYMVSMYGTSIRVNSLNKKFTTDVNGYLIPIGK